MKGNPNTIWSPSLWFPNLHAATKGKTPIQQTPVSLKFPCHSRRLSNFHQGNSPGTVRTWQMTRAGWHRTGQSDFIPPPEITQSKYLSLGVPHHHRTTRQMSRNPPTLTGLSFPLIPSTSSPPSRIHWEMETPKKGKPQTLGDISPRKLSACWMGTGNGTGG